MKIHIKKFNEEIADESGGPIKKQSKGEEQAQKLCIGIMKICNLDTTDYDIVDKVREEIIIWYRLNKRLNTEII